MLLSFQWNKNQVHLLTGWSEKRGLNSCQGEWEGERTSEGRIAGNTKVPPEVSGQGFSQTSLLARRFSSPILSCSAVGVRKLDFIMI